MEALSGLDWLDIAFLIVVGLSIIGGLVRGLARELFGLAGVVAGFILALTFAAGWSLFLERWLPPPAAYAAMFILVLMGTTLLADLVGQLVTGLLKAVKLSVPNRLAGGIFGVFRGALLAIVLFIGLLFFTDDPMRLTAGSKGAPWAASGARVVLRWFPEQHRHYVEARLPDRNTNRLPE